MYSHLFCSKPFNFIDIKRNKAGVCCWVKLPIWQGESADFSIDSAWNSDNAQKIRKSILDGSFSYCSKDCPFLHGAAAPPAVQEKQDSVIHGFLSAISNPVQGRDQLKDTGMLQIIRDNLCIMPDLPAFVECGFDNSCNLSCPSCRNERQVETEHQENILVMQNKVEQQLFPGLKSLYITGSGDPFGSPYFNRWLRKMSVSHFSDDAFIHLHTNAQLWDEAMWNKLPESVRERCKTCEISIDGTSAATYELNRRGGDFNRLLNNLEFIAGLKRERKLLYLKIHMVVQENNYHEMPDFVALGRRLSADEVYFSYLSDWGTFSVTELEMRQVHLPTHARYHSFLKVLKHPYLREPCVNLGNLNDIDCAQYQKTHHPLIRLRELVATGS
ncbi:radical SAM protein [Iodobacter sp. HSC-16F04]|uniref:Radical SAM protein n=1 Tax=Iodobacter violaceini TaxID=3044271 RepID=A0ABX0KMZ8_9NEIS|nr:radical SAM protein [Iodobacter violacea]NHQ85781.1 radical SAM protein [Iodobacter violacea]